MISTQINKQDFVVGSSAVFPFGVRFFDKSDIVCYLYQNDVSRKLDGTEFSVEEKTSYSDGANVTLNIDPLPTGATLTIMRILAKTQDVALPNAGKLPSESLEKQLDKQIMIAQELQENINRAVVIPPGSAATPAGLMDSLLAATADAAASAASAAASAANIAEAEETCEEYAQQAANMANKDLDNLTDAGKAAIMSYGVPVGIPLPFAGAGDIPVGFLLCNGAAISRTTYSGLYSKIGATYGAGDGTTTFNIPDLRGAFLRGYDGTRSAAIGTAQNDGLPNIQGTIATNPDNEYSAFGEAILSSRTGALNVTTRTQQLISGASSTVTSIAGITFNASNSNSIYGASSYVTPYNYAMNYIIKY